MLGNSLVAERLAAFQEGLSSMELVSYGCCPGLCHLDRCEGGS
jgi:hypothetical protein